MRTDDNSYQLLGVSRHQSPEALKRAFRQRLLAVHPDRNPNDSLATERTRRIIEAYHALCRSLDSARTETSAQVCERPASCVIGTPGRRIAASGWVLKTLSVLALMAVMAWVVLSAVRAVFGGPAFVFQPNPEGLTVPADTRIVAPIVEPGIGECVEWYFAQRYRLSVASEWAARELLKTFEEAARKAELRGDISQAEFYRSAINRITRARHATLL